MAWKGVQMFPEDWDGVIAGDPAQWTPHLDGHQYWYALASSSLLQ